MFFLVLFFVILSLYLIERTIYALGDLVIEIYDSSPRFRRFILWSAEKQRAYYEQLLEDRIQR